MLRRSFLKACACCVVLPALRWVVPSLEDPRLGINPNAPCRWINFTMVWTAAELEAGGDGGSPTFFEGMHSPPDFIRASATA